MDFKRIQVLLLVFFLVFDAYLVYILYSRAAEARPIDTAIEYTIEEELKNRGIVFHKLSQDKVNLPLIKVDPTPSLENEIEKLEGQVATVDDKDRIVSTFDVPLDLTVKITNQTQQISSEDAEKLLKDTIKNPKWFALGDQYQFYRYSAIERAIYFRMNAYQNYKIVDGTAEIKLVLNDQFQVTNYIQTFQKGIKELDTQVTTISERDALQVVDGRVETYIPNNSTINSTKLSYYRMNNLEKFSVYSPVWEIVYTQPDGTMRLIYVEATRGTILSPG